MGQGSDKSRVNTAEQIFQNIQHEYENLRMYMEIEKSNAMIFMVGGYEDSEGNYNTMSATIGNYRMLVRLLAESILYSENDKTKELFLDAFLEYVKRSGSIAGIVKIPSQSMFGEMLKATILKQFRDNNKDNKDEGQ